MVRNGFFEGCLHFHVNNLTEFSYLQLYIWQLAKSFSTMPQKIMIKSELEISGRLVVWDNQKWSGQWFLYKIKGQVVGGKQHWKTEEKVQLNNKIHIESNKWLTWTIQALLRPFFVLPTALLLNTILCLSVQGRFWNKSCFFHLLAWR